MSRLHDALPSTHIFPKYDMPYSEMQRATIELAKKHKGILKPGNYGCFKITDDMDPEAANTARAIETAVFGAAFDNGPTVMEALYGPYEDVSHFYLSAWYDPRYGIHPVGALRAVSQSDAGFMTVSTLPDEALQSGTQNDAGHLLRSNGITDLSAVWDVGTAAILPGHRKTEAGLQLYRALYKDACKSDIEYLLTILDAGLLSKLRGLGIPFDNLLGTVDEFEYEGSPRSSAVRGHVPDFRPHVISRDLLRRGMTMQQRIARVALAYGVGVDGRIAL